MAVKRKHDEHASENDASNINQARLSKKPKKGFSVGPEHLPDGPQRRKVQKLKRDLIEKAKTKKEYAKMKQKLLDTEKSGEQIDDLQDNNTDQESAMHPDRVARLQNEPIEHTQDGNMSHPKYEAQVSDSNENEVQGSHENSGRQKRTKIPRYAKEQAIAAKRKEEAEARRAAKAEAQRQREEKQAERERYRRAMEKARAAGKNGQRKLGRESGVLLERVRRMMDK